MVENKTADLQGQIKEREQAEETLRERTQTLDEILEKAADGICVCHNTSEFPFVKFYYWNPRMAEGQIGKRCSR